MSDVYLRLISYLGGIWRRRWHAIAVTWLVCGVGWSTVAVLSDRYESSARIYVDMDTMLGPLMRGMTVQMDLFQQIDIMRRTLLSRPNLEKILLMTDLDLRAHNEADKEKLFDELKARIDVKQQGRNLFEISYENTERSLAKRVVQSVMQVFVEGNLGASRKDMETTQRFLENQIRDYERQLVEAEARLAKFKRDNMGLLPGSGNYYEHMQDMNKKLAEVEAKIGEATMVRDEYMAQLKKIPETVAESTGANSNKIIAAAQSAPFGTGPGSTEQFRLIELRDSLNQLLSVYTENHPDVQAVKRQIAAVQKKFTDAAKPPDASDPAMEEQPLPGESPAMSSADDNRASEGNMGAVTPNPMYDQIKLQIVQQEGFIAALKSRAADTRKQVEKWSNLAKLVPQVEADLAQKMRDYELIRKGYLELRQRQESAKLAREMESSANKVQFRIIDPPKLPVKPSGPNRPLLMSVVLVMGLAAGIAFAFVLSQINSTFNTVQRLRSTFTLPVLGRVTAIVSPRERRQRRCEVVGFATITLALLGAFGVLITIEVADIGKALGSLDQLRNLL